VPIESCLSGPQGEPGRAGLFVTTRWSVVLAANSDSEQGREALEVLCGTYWFPVYALARRRGCDPEAARDATQEFFARMLTREGFARARSERGRFRSFLAQSVKNFLIDEWEKASAQRRGGGKAPISLDAEAAEGRYLETPTLESPDRLFDRQWAEQLIAAAYARLRQEYDQAGRSAWLEVMGRVGEPNTPPLAEEAARLQMPLNTLKSHLRRARLRQVEILRELIAETVSTPGEVELELRELLAALGDSSG
jgi:DNA-directed RNA polymerase specialized sigma24 family protein